MTLDDWFFESLVHLSMFCMITFPFLDGSLNILFQWNHYLQRRARGVNKHMCRQVWTLMISISVFMAALWLCQGLLSSCRVLFWLYVSSFRSCYSVNQCLSGSSQDSLYVSIILSLEMYVLKHLKLSPGRAWSGRHFTILSHQGL